MNLATIAWKSIRERGLASSLTALSVALGVMLMVAVLVIYGILQSIFSQRAINYDLIVGAKGDPLQLVLSTVYHISPPIENLPYRYFQELKKDPRVAVAIPVAMGDVTEQGGFPIVGTVPEFFDVDYAPKQPFMVKGHGFRRDFDAYIGDRVARENGWGLGSKLKLVHGGAESDHVHDEEFEVVGILAPTGTPHDKTVYVNLKGFYQIQGHDKPLKEAIERERKFFGEPALTDEELKSEIARIQKKYGVHDHSAGGHDHHGHSHDLPDVQKEVTAVLLQCKSAIAANLMAGELKKGNQGQGVNPIVPMQRLFTEFLAPAQAMFLVMTALIVLVSGIGIFVSIYNSMSARRREIAIMRALGAQRGTVLTIVLAESIILCVGGGLLGLLLGHGLVFAAAPIVAAKTGLLIDPRAFSTYELVVLPVLLLMGALVGFLPGMTAYQTDVAESLNN
ncbi:ABC transporter permease [Schlesneria sp. DSM 10557]|uniref:ABC transporter permease n=1 Tax=Schlesneria sp. DSM 10557 TaxID=3044399 RepID=UPI00359F8AD9